MIQIILVDTGDIRSAVCQKIRDKVRGSAFRGSGTPSIHISFVSISATQTGTRKRVHICKC
jgi:hypothetical protein